MVLRMGHGKLRKFAENETFRCLLQPDASSVLVKDGSSRHVREVSRALVLRDHPIKGRWLSEMFPSHPGPIVLELGCGKGDYTIALAERHPEMNFIGVDIKGARLWKGAKYATEKALPNVAFLRTRIEFIGAFFAPGEVSVIWLTFSDPQMGSENARLTSPLFLERYRGFLRPGGVVHLKTDSRFLHEYTLAVVRANALPLLAASTDVYGPSGLEGHGGVAVRTSLRDPSQPGHGSCDAAGLGSVPAPDAFSRGQSVPCVPVLGTQATKMAENVSCVPFLGTQGTVGGTAVAATYAGSMPVDTTDAGEITVDQRVDWDDVTGVQTFYESMFLKMGLPITYMAFTLEHEGPFVHPADFDADFWRAAEGPRRTFSHNPSKGT